jgi:hypothetical protein
MPRLPVFILGAWATHLTSSGPPRNAVFLCVAALHGALKDARMRATSLDALVTAPTLAGGALAGHRLAQAAGLGLSERRPFPLIRSLDACGAAGVACLLEARALVQSGAASAVAVVLGDAVSSASLPTAAFLERADAAVGGAHGLTPAQPALPSPAIPAGYDALAAWALGGGLLARADLAAYASLAALHGSRHPGGLAGKGKQGEERPSTSDYPHQPPALSADTILRTGRPVGPATTLFECARRADGAAAVIVGGADAVRARGGGGRPPPILIAGGGRASGPLTPAHPLTAAAWAPLEAAVAGAYAEARTGPADVDVWFPYDCYPITALAALAAMGAVAPRGGGARAPGGGVPSFGSVAAGLAAAGRAASSAAAALVDPGGGPGASSPAAAWPVNTHGGLLGGGAPWAAPALFSVVEAAVQLRGEAGVGRQVPGARVAVVQGNGGILSEQAVAVLRAGE